MDTGDDVSMEDTFRIMREVAVNREPDTPDTPAQAAFRERMYGAKAAAESRGEMFYIPDD